MYPIACVANKLKLNILKSGGDLKRLPILMWKWDHITIDFVVGLPRN